MGSGIRVLGNLRVLPKVLVFALYIKNMGLGVMCASIAVIYNLKER